MKWFLFTFGLLMSYFFIYLDREFTAIVTAIFYSSMIVAEAIRTK